MGATQGRDVHAPAVQGRRGGTSRRAGLAAVAVAAATLAVAPAAHAGPPFKLATQQDDPSPPSVATSSSGISHVVWAARDEAERPVLRYCRISRIKSRCSRARTIFPRLESTRADIGRHWIFVMPDPRTGGSTQKLVIVAYLGAPREEAPPGGGGYYAIESSDLGRTFERPRKIAYAHRFDNAAPGPGDSISFANGAEYWNAPLSGAGIDEGPPRGYVGRNPLPASGFSARAAAGAGGENVAAVPRPAPDTAPASEGGHEHAVVVMRNEEEPDPADPEGRARRPFLEYNFHTGAGDLNGPFWSQPSRMGLPTSGFGLGLAGGPLGIVAASLYKDPRQEGSQVGTQCLIERRPECAFGWVSVPGLSSSGGALNFDISADPVTGFFHLAVEARRGIYYAFSSDGYTWRTRRVVYRANLRRGFETGIGGQAGPEVSGAGARGRGHLAWSAGRTIFGATLR